MLELEAVVLAFIAVMRKHCNTAAQQQLQPAGWIQQQNLDHRVTRHSACRKHLQGRACLRRWQCKQKEAVPCLDNPRAQLETVWLVPA